MYIYIFETSMAVAITCSISRAYCLRCEGPVECNKFCSVLFCAALFYNKCMLLMAMFSSSIAGILARYFQFVFTVHFLYITLINTPTKCTIDDRITFYSLTPSTLTCFGAPWHHLQGDFFALQRPLSLGEKHTDYVILLPKLITYKHILCLVGFLKIKTMRIKVKW
jgi:hypothetical protein